MNFSGFIAAAVLMFGVSAVAVPNTSRVVPPSMESYHIITPIQDQYIYLLTPDAKSAWRVELFSDFTYDASEIWPAKVPNTLPPKDWGVGGGRPVLRNDTDYVSVIKKFRDADGWDVAYPQSVRDSLEVGFPDSWMQSELHRGEYGLFMISGNSTNLNRNKPFGVVIGESDVHDNTTVDIDWLVRSNPKKGESRLADVSDVEHFPAIARSLTFSSREDPDAKLRLTFRVVLTHELRRERDPDAYSVCGNPVLPNEGIAYRPTKVDLPTIPPVTVTDSLPPIHVTPPAPEEPMWEIAALGRYGDGRSYVDNVPISSSYNYGDVGIRLERGKDEDPLNLMLDAWLFGLRDFEADGTSDDRERVQRLPIFTLLPRVTVRPIKWFAVSGEYGASWDYIPFADLDSQTATVGLFLQPGRFRAHVDYNNTWIEEFWPSENSVRWGSDMGMLRGRAGWLLWNPGHEFGNVLEVGVQGWWMNYRDRYWSVHTTPGPGGAYAKVLFPLDDLHLDGAKFSIDAGYMRGWVEAQHNQTHVRIRPGINHLWQVTGEIHLPLWKW